MKFIVISDTHDHMERIRHVLGFGKSFGVDGVIHCGDWSSTQAIEETASFDIPVYGVLGNADIDPRMVEDLKKYCAESDEDFLKLEFGGKKIGICHFLNKLKDKMGDSDVLFCGHTHRRADQLIGPTRIVNPGALGRTSEPSFVVYDGNDIQFIDVKI